MSSGTTFSDRVARERALETERSRRVSADLIAMMRDAGLFRIMQPRAYGGDELGDDVFRSDSPRTRVGDRTVTPRLRRSHRHDARRRPLQDYAAARLRRV